MNKEPVADFSRYHTNPDYLAGVGQVDTGPGGLRDNRPQQASNAQAVGAGSISPEQTLDVAYILRAAPGAPLERPRSLMPGEIGWGIPWLVDVGLPKTGHRIDMGEFRHPRDDTAVHENIGVWCPGPQDCVPAEPPECHGVGFNNRSDSGFELPPNAALHPDTSKRLPETAPSSRGRFRPLEATQHLGLFRNC